jgi:hypothetical protein
MRRTVAVLGLALCLVLAGCGGGAGDTPTPGQSPAPGIEDGALTDTGALLDAHESALAESGFVSVVTREGDLLQTVQRNGSTQEVLVDTRVNQTVYATAALSGYVSTTRTEYDGRSGSQIDRWANESVQYTRLVVGEQQRIQRSQPQDAAAVTSRSLLSAHLQSGNYSVVDVSGAGDDRRITLSATGATDDPTLATGEGRQLTEYGGTLVVDGEGRVRSLDATFTYTVDGETATLESTYSLRATGGVSIQRPDWLPA